MRQEEKLPTVPHSRVAGSTPARVRFPAVCFASGVAWIASGWQDITTTTRRGLRSGKFNDLLIVDSHGEALRFEGALEIGKTRRPPWAPRPSFSKWIEVELQPVGRAERITIEALRERTLRSFDEWHGWSAAYDIEATKHAIDKASYPEEIVHVLARGRP